MREATQALVEGVSVLEGEKSKLVHDEPLLDQLTYFERTYKTASEREDYLATHRAAREAIHQRLEKFESLMEKVRVEIEERQYLNEGFQELGKILNEKLDEIATLKKQASLTTVGLFGWNKQDVQMEKANAQELRAYQDKVNAEIQAVKKKIGELKKEYEETLGELATLLQDVADF